MILFTSAVFWIHFIISKEFLKDLTGGFKVV
jgi:hypothetical protein